MDLSKKFEHLWSIFTRTELWITVATIIAVLIESNVFDETSAIFKVLSLGLAVLAAMGYAASRSFVKVARAKAIGEAAKTPDP